MSNIGTTPHIRAVLRQHPDGLTVDEIKQHLPVIRARSAIRAALEERMADVYRDRWVRTTDGRAEPVYIAVPIPPHCPAPD